MADLYIPYLTTSIIYATLRDGNGPILLTGATVSPVAGDPSQGGFTEMGTATVFDGVGGIVKWTINPAESPFQNGATTLALYWKVITADGQTLHVPNDRYDSIGMLQ